MIKRTKNINEMVGTSVAYFLEGPSRAGKPGIPCTGYVTRIAREWDMYDDGEKTDDVILYVCLFDEDSVYVHTEPVNVNDEHLFDNMSELRKVFGQRIKDEYEERQKELLSARIDDKLESIRDMLYTKLYDRGGIMDLKSSTSEDMRKINSNLKTVLRGMRKVLYDPKTSSLDFSNTMTKMFAE